MLNDYNKSLVPEFGESLPFGLEVRSSITPRAHEQQHTKKSL